MTSEEPNAIFSCDIANVGDAVTVTARGEIDLASSPQLRDALQTGFAQGPQVLVLDLAAVTFIDSSGLGVLVGALKRMNEANAGSRLELRSMTSSVRRVFEITGLTDVFAIVD